MAILTKRYALISSYSIVILSHSNDPNHCSVLIINAETRHAKVLGTAIAIALKNDGIRV